jgi:hypothetical protein
MSQPRKSRIVPDGNQLDGKQNCRRKHREQRQTAVAADTTTGVR